MGHRQGSAGIRGQVDGRGVVHGNVAVLVLICDARIFCDPRVVTRITRNLRRDGFRGGPTNTGDWYSHGARSDDFGSHEARSKTRNETGRVGNRDWSGRRVGTDTFYEGAAGRRTAD